ncbi:MAG: DUF4870 domain-containing protein [Anaerolineales bacterium]|nr:DUF4870 domain-containing protein [Anaerolineales bacterium]
MNEQIPQTPPAPLTPAEERQWAMFAHLGVLVNLISGFLGPLVPLAIYFIYKDRSRYVAYQSLQALIFQLIWWIGGGALTGVAWAITGTLSAFVIGLICVPFACIISAMPLAALGYGVYAGIQCNQGVDFKYWLIGDWMRGTLNG